MTPAAKPKKACVLVSGGFESGVLLAEAAKRYDSVTPLYVRNELRWEDAELYWLKKFLRLHRPPNLEPLKIVGLTMKDLYEGHWSVTGIRVPAANTPLQSVYLPGRNIILLSKASVFCAIHEITVIEIGLLNNNPFSDGSASFFNKMAKVLSLGLKHDIRVRVPFRKLKKEEVLEIGKVLPMEYTFSCINPKGYDHCGECNKCMQRKKAFFAAGIKDKTKYRKEGL